jgi:tetratricopeptide (TPR) repeat protein
MTPVGFLESVVTSHILILKPQYHLSSPVPMSSSRITILFAVPAFLLPLLLYIYTLCPTVPVGDGGELICAAHDLGIAHPTGYPLFCLLGRTFSLLLPVNNVAVKLNLMSALLAALTVLVAFFLARETFPQLSLKDSFRVPLAALISALVLAFSRTLWSHAVQTEVYALHAFLVAVLLLILVRWLRTGDARMAHLGAFLFGLSLTNHTSAMILVVPVLFVMVRGRERLRLREHLPGLLLFFFLGISLYLYLPWRSALQPPNDWGDPETLARLWNHLTARLYHRHFVLTWPAEMIRNLRQYVRLLIPQFGPWLFVVGFLGAWWQVRHRFILFFVFLLTWLANILLAASYGITDIDAYYLPSHLMVSLWIGMGMHAIISWAASRLGRLGVRLLASILLLVLVGSPLAANFSRASQRGMTIARDYGLNILSSVQPDAVLLAFSDNEYFPILYLHQVERIRSDVTILGLASTEAQLRRFLGQKEDVSTGDQGRLLRAVVEYSSRPVNNTKEHMSPKNDVLQATGFSLWPFGLVYRHNGASRQARGDPLPWSGYRQQAFQHLERYSDYRAVRMAANYYLSWGEDLLARGDSLAAVEKFSIAQSSIEDHRLSILHSEMAIFFRRIGWLPGAQQEFRRAMISPWKSLRDESHIHGNYGNLLAELGDGAGAQREWHQALQIWSGNWEAQFNLARFKANRSLQEGRFGEAAAEFEKMLRLDPDNPVICYNLGALYAYRLNDPLRAREYLQRCIDIDPEGAAAAAAAKELKRLRSGNK